MIGVFWLPAAVLLCLCLLPCLDRSRNAWPQRFAFLSSLVLCLALAVFTCHTGSTAPAWSCPACHKETFGKAFSRPPDSVKTFSKRYDNNWLALHSRYPQYFWMMDATVPAW
jgi:hypothetical protein